MGNQAAKGKDLPPGVKYDSREYWEFQLGKNFAPIESCEEYCQRFNSTPEGYQQRVKEFDQFRTKGPDGAFLRPYITKEEFLAPYGNNQAAKELFSYVWNAFDADNNNQLDLEEFLVLYGVLHQGTQEQKIMAFFALCDQNHTHKVRHEDLMKIMTAAAGIAHQDPGELSENMKYLVKTVDKDHSGTMELNEVMKACRKDEKIAHFFTVCFTPKKR